MFFKLSGSSGFMPVASIATSENFEGCAVDKMTLFPSSGIFFIAGDVGAFENVTKIFCEKVDKIKFIATGMGSGKNDNFLKIKISDGGELVSIYPIIFWIWYIQSL